MKTHRVAGTCQGPQEVSGVTEEEEELTRSQCGLQQLRLLPEAAGVWAFGRRGPLLFQSCQGPDRCVTPGGGDLYSTGEEGYSPVITGRQ